VIVLDEENRPQRGAMWMPEIGMAAVVGASANVPCSNV